CGQGTHWPPYSF
nr:immunoglobulin light chain junction region [Macaca mulatta]MOX07133.1 immunoglobulin light chain junction region [Macaca mulatta]MOX07178.1 immunoglobulin light chain junction region [Macaca mulatta]MOX07238.1 immunoglobulin light chain junction region [Macaca mulatta]MOX07287.1 immunoglobulin light chain junction region [Macaca mulatta]